MKMMTGSDSTRGYKKLKRKRSMINKDTSPAAQDNHIESNIIIVGLTQSPERQNDRDQYNTS